MSLIYETVEEATTRLAQSYFLYRGEPVFCREVVQDSGRIMLRLLFCPRLVDEATVPVTDPDLNFTKFTLGYINVRDGATYLSRLPAVGRYKQGLSREACSFSRLVATNGQTYRYELDQAAKEPGFRDMLLNKYPSFEEACERIQLEDGPQSVAFSRYFAVAYDKFRKDFLLLYKGEKIGFGESAFIIPEEFRYLQEVCVKNQIRMR